MLLKTVSEMVGVEKCVVCRDAENVAIGPHVVLSQPGIENASSVLYMA